MPRIVVALGLVLFVGVRLHVLDDEFPNPDIAGLVYNADLLLDGGLPYVDTVEVKPPGSFFMAALCFALLGRGVLALQLGHALWLLAAAPAVWLIVSRLTRRERPEVRTLGAAMATAVYLTYAPMFTYNYSSWMMPASAWAVAAAIMGLHNGRWRWHLLAGAAAMLAFVTIQRAVVVGALLPALYWWARRQDELGATPRAWAGWTLGAALVASLLAVPYWVAGQLGALVGGVVPLDVAARYTERADADIVATVIGAATQLVETFWFAVAVIALAALAERGRHGSSPRRGGWVVGALWLLASIAGAAIGGGRFYIHYLVQYVPALAVLAGHPSLAEALLEPAGRRKTIFAAGVGLAVVAQLAEVGLERGDRYEAKARRLKSGSTAAQAAGAHIAQRTVDADRIACWGWTAWRVYFWADRRAPGPIYKPMGTLTTFNGNTAFSRGDGVALVQGPRTEQYIQAFDARPPMYFVYSPSFEATFGAESDPLTSFDALLLRLERDYVPEAEFGDLRLFRRRPGV